MSHTVGQVAGYAGVTVRTLHHYDQIGLLVPSERTHAGHRRYGDDDLDRLQQILGTWFYDCPYEMHQGLGEMYVSDERFKAFYDAMRPGLAEHLRDAINANAARTRP